MQLTFADEKMTAVDDQGNWLGEIACPVLDHERKIVVVERVFVATSTASRVAVAPCCGKRS